MVVFDRQQRVLLAETLRDIANIAAGAMVFGQFLGTQTFSIGVAVSGVSVWAGLVGYAISLAGRPKS